MWLLCLHLGLLFIWACVAQMSSLEALSHWLGCACCLHPGCTLSRLFWTRFGAAKCRLTGTAVHLGLCSLGDLGGATLRDSIAGICAVLLVPLAAAVTVLFSCKALGPHVCFLCCANNHESGGLRLCRALFLFWSPEA